MMKSDVEFAQPGGREDLAGGAVESLGGIAWCRCRTVQVPRDRGRLAARAADSSARRGRAAGPRGSLREVGPRDWTAPRPTTGARMSASWRVPLPATAAACLVISTRRTP